MIPLAGRPIIITGASSGIGRATALACAAEGMPVAVLARRAERLADLIGQIESSGGRAIAVAGDVTQPADCERLVEQCLEAFGSVYGVFACAGFGQQSAVHEVSESDLRAIFETNFFGSLNVIRPALEPMLEAGGGHVLMCSSCLSKISIPWYAPYCATKACQNIFGRAMRIELRGRGVHVSTIHPAGTRTELFDVMRDRSDEELITDLSPDRFMQTPERVARAVISCLRRPRAEVWTRPTLRAALVLGDLVPRLTDALLARQIARARARLDQ
ncbi:MAG: SDR family NAD(P)-dependent oxidoreductase [Phycisphaerales bacterium JB039]